MEKRYQIFISSTFVDLQEERQGVLKAVLELDHMPAGMELFPATDDTAWRLICDVIDASDYYALIIGGRYGSLDASGLSYTEKEYDHAVATRKPVIPLLHENPEALPRSKTEGEAGAWERLKKFRSKVESKHTCVYWKNGDDLRAKIIVGLTAAIKRHPAVGWIRADKVPSDATLAEVLNLRNRIAELEAEATTLKEEPPSGVESLSQGDEKFLVQLSFVARFGRFPDTVEESFEGSVKLSWNAIFAAVAPSMINESPDAQLRQSFRQYFQREALREFAPMKKFKAGRLGDFKFRTEDIDTCLIQFRALGLIRENERKRSVKDTGTYWSLTPYGNKLMVQLRAIRKEPVAEQDLGGVLNSPSSGTEG